jgi:hypothetical protein
MFGSKKKQITTETNTFQKVSDGLEKMEIEPNSKSKKGKNAEKWQPWNVAKSLKISDEELENWLQRDQQDRKSQSKEQLLETLMELLVERFPKEMEPTE